jgi:DNA primase
MSTINEIKQRIDIVEVVSDYVSLQKAGRNFKGLCPFHSEKHPSFYVFPQQQTWHCFGACGTGGDVFSFIMRKEGSDFGQALRFLAQKAGVTLSPPEAQPKTGEEERLFHVNEAAAQYYHYLLLNTKAGEATRNYLSRRKVTLETIEEFRLGFSPDNWETLKRYLISKGHEEGELVEAGLLVEREDGNSYDRFRNRLMFPICDVQGRVTGFGARALDDSLPKYINSPQTPIFDKSNSLYGIDKAKDAIRERNLVIIVEGYMDVLLPHQHGWKNVVASMGTSLTEKQVDIIRRLTRNISLALDADAAGEEATLRGAEVLLQSLDKKATSVLSWSEELASSLHKGITSPSLAGLVKYENALDAEIKVISLPQGKDPDEIISENPSLWQNLVEQASPILDFAFTTVASKIDVNKVKDKSLAIQKLLPLINEIKDPIRQDHYGRKLARLLKVSAPALTANLRKLQANKKRYQPTEKVKQARFAHQFVSSPVEEYCLALLLQYPELRQQAQELSAEHFECTENQEIFAQWQRSPDISTLRNKLDINLLEHLNYLLNKIFPPAIQENEGTRQLALADCILRLQEKFFKDLEVKKEAMLEIERGKQGVASEFDKLKEQGISSSQQLKEIFVKRGVK